MHDEDDVATRDVMLDVLDEIQLADERIGRPGYASHHEGYGVLREEVAEYEAWVFERQESRDLAAARKEAVQVAAVAIRIARDLCDEERGRR